MDNHIVLTGMQVLDLLFRFATTGTLLLLFIFVLNNGEPNRKKASMCLIVCLASYVLLTAPIENEHYGWFRPPLLLFTNCIPYALIAVYWHKVRGTSVLAILPAWVKGAFFVWFTGLAWFFVIEHGIGVFHTWHDGFALVVMAMIVVDAIRDFDDDLVESRRDIRKLAITFITVYSLFLTVIEMFFRSLKDDSLFSIANSLLILLITCYFSYRALQQNLVSSPTSSVSKDTHKSCAAPQENPAVIKLEELMQQEIYKQNGLTITKLANAMELPEHQLRVIINQELGFDNFSQFLNSYRIPAICQKLEQTEHQNTPILTLALDTGYNSIAPFNRAFKELKGVTPTQYRQGFAAQFQK